MTGQPAAKWDLEIYIKGTLDARSQTMNIRVETKYTLDFNYTGQSTLPQLFLYWKLTPSYSESDIAMEPRRINLNATNPVVSSTNVVGKLSALNTQIWGVNVRITAPGATPEQVMDYSTSNTYIRCDNSAEIWPTDPKPGCVNVKWTPTVDFPASLYPNISQNIANGKASHSNAGSTSNPLVKVTGAERATNYNNTCGNAAYRDPLIGPKPAPDPMTGKEFQCDEYPFASSTQGGPGNNLMWVPESENQSQGGRLSSLYTTNRLLPGDNFYVN